MSDIAVEDGRSGPGGVDAAPGPLTVDVPHRRALAITSAPDEAAPETSLDQPPGASGTRKAILDSARRLLESTGARPISMRAVAAGAGVSAAAIYNHFRSREHLLAAAAEPQLRLAMTGRLGGDAALLDKRLATLLSFAARQPRSLLALLRSEQSDVRESTVRELELMVAGATTCDNAERVAQALCAALEGVASVSERWPDEAEALAGDVGRLLTGGLRRSC